MLETKIDTKDIQYHVDKQELPLNVDQMYKAFENIGYRPTTIYKTICRWSIRFKRCMFN